ncbi:MAG: TRAP transporter substrate-binding protein [Bacteroidota bacterium]
MRYLIAGRYLLAVFVCTLLASAWAGCNPQSDVTVVKLGHGLDPVHPVHQGMEFMAEKVVEKSGGKMRVDIYPSQQLGSERELLELLQLGSLGMTKVTAAVLESFAPSFKAFSVPYLFRDRDHHFRVLEGEIGKELLLASQAYWLRGLAYYDAGSRSFYTKEKPIHSPADLAGLKIRTLESKTQVDMVNTMGGAATPISWGELYTALQQGVVDGAENNPPSLYTSRQYEVCKYYTLDEHTTIPDVLLISTIVWEALTPQEQTWLQEAADESAQYQKVLWQEASDAALVALEENGIEIIRPDKTPFAESVAPIYESFKSEPAVYDIIQRIRATE